MKKYPKLKYPLNRKGLNDQDGFILLAYDIIWRWAENASISHMDEIDGITLQSDAEANLTQLGAYIERTMGEDRFEPKPFFDELNKATHRE